MLVRGAVTFIEPFGTASVNPKNFGVRCNAATNPVPAPNLVRRDVTHDYRPTRASRSDVDRTSWTVAPAMDAVSTTLLTPIFWCS